MKSLEILDYLSAKSLVGLRRLMVRNNVKKHSTIHYFDIQFVKGKWYAFYYHRPTDQDPIFKEGES